MRPGFSIIEHPADVGIEARGGSVREAFEQAAYGLMSLIVDASSVTHAETRTIFVEATDQEQLLVRWLNELLYLYDGEKFVPVKFEIGELSPQHLRALVGGERFDQHRHRTRVDVKAMTYHQLAIVPSIDAVTITYVVDV